MTYSGGGVLAGSGLNGIVVAAMESAAAYGVAVSPTTWIGSVTDCVLGRETTIYESFGIGNIRTMQKQINTAKRYSASLKGEMDNGIPFAMALGAISAISDPNIYILKGAGHIAAGSYSSIAYLPSWTLAREFDEATDDSISLLGAVCQRGTFNIDLDGPFTFDLEFVAKSEATTDATAGTPPTDCYGSWNTAVNVKEATAAYSSSGDVEIDALKNIKLSVNNNLIVRNQFGTTAPVSIRQPIPGKAVIELELTRGFVDDDLWDEITDGGVDSYNFTCTSGSNSLSISAQSAFCKSIKSTTNLTDQTNEVAVFSVKDVLVAVADGATYVKSGFS